MKQILFLIAFLFLIVGVSAGIENIGTAKKSECITLPQICNCSYANITTIIYPNKTQVAINQAMTKSGTYFNYTFCGTEALGQYLVNGIGDNNGAPQTFNYYFLVTNTGFEASIAQGLTIFFAFGFIIVLGVLFFIIGLRTEMMGLKLFFLSMTIILMVFLIGYIINIADITLGEFPTLTSGFTPLYILFITLLSVGAFGLIIYLIAYSMDAFYRSRGFRD